MSKAYSRRNVLGGLAAAPVLSALSPFLPVGMVSAATPPKRLLTIFHPMGYLESTFWPTSDASGYKLDANMAALEPWKSKLIFPDGIVLHNSGGNAHGAGVVAVFTGSSPKPLYPSSPSYDYLIAEHLYAQEKTPHKYLALGVDAHNNAHEANHAFYTGPGKYIVKDNSPASVFDTVFSRLAGTGMVDESAILRAKAQKKSVIDLIKSDLDRICRKVGAQEKAKCEAHLDSIRAMELNLATLPAPMTCTKPARPSGGGFAQTADAQFDMIAAAFACDQTRVASITMGHCNGGIDVVSGVNQHDTTHAVGDRAGDPGPVNDHKRLDQVFTQRWAQLFKKLDSYKEGNGSLLDNTLVLISSDTTTGMAAGSRGAHQHRRMTFLMGGGANFAFKTGRHIKLASPNDKAKTSHHRLLTSISRAFGLNVNKVGDFDPSSGPLEGLL
jgi:Protein of unknown function (DUF1552)